MRTIFKRVYELVAQPSSYGHTTVKAPHPIRTAKLSIVGLVQYFGRGLRGNNQCCMAFLFFSTCDIQVYFFSAQPSSYGHTTVKAPHPIRTAKLSIVGLVQYFGRGLRGNNQCCMAFLFLFLFLFFFLPDIFFFAKYFFWEKRSCNQSAAAVHQNTIFMKQRREIK